MKNSRLFFTRILFTGILMVMAAFTVHAQSGTTSSENDTTYIKMRVDGLACPFCAYGLEKKIKKIDGASDLFIEINEGYITFSVPDWKKPDEAALKKLVKEAGFTARDITFSKKPFKTHEN